MTPFYSPSPPLPNLAGVHEVSSSEHGRDWLREVHMVFKEWRLRFLYLPSKPLQNSYLGRINII